MLQLGQEGSTCACWYGGRVPEQLCVHALDHTLHAMNITSSSTKSPDARRGSVPVMNNKWGDQDRRETSLEGDMNLLPMSASGQCLADRLTGFFHFYAFEFKGLLRAVGGALKMGLVVKLSIG